MNGRKSGVGFNSKSVVLRQKGRCLQNQKPQSTGQSMSLQLLTIPAARRESRCSLCGLVMPYVQRERCSLLTHQSFIPGAGSRRTHSAGYAVSLWVSREVVQAASSR